MSVIGARRADRRRRGVDLLREELAVVRGEALARLEVELPAMERTGEHTVLNLTEAGEVGLQVRAAALDHVPLALDQRLIRTLLDVVPLGVLDPLRREALEEAVEELVVLPLALGLEPAREEDVVHPVLFVVDDAVLHQRRVDDELEPGRRHPVPLVDLALDEVDNDLSALAEIEQQQVVDAD